MKKYLNTDFDPDRLVDLFDELPLWSAPFGLKLLDYVDYGMNISALDIGFGAGFPLTELAMRLGESSLVYGLDPWKEMFGRVRKKLDFYGINHVKIIEGVAESIPLEDHSVDLITSNNGINNVADIGQALSECSRVIRQGGQFVQTMNTDLTMFEFYGHFEQVLAEMGLQKEIGLMHRHISQKRPAVDGFVTRVRDHGFVIKDLEHDQFNYRFADGTAMLSHYFIRLAFMESWMKLLPPEKVGPVFESVERRLNEQARQLGGLKLSVPFVLINAIKT